MRAVPTRTRRAAGALLAALALVVLGAAPAWAAEGAAVGQYQGPSAGTSDPTQEKPESKLWFNDGSWWSVMVVGTGGHRIWRLDAGSQQWSDTGVVVDPRTTARVDVLWDGTSLAVASHVFVRDGGAEGNPSHLRRFSYDAAADTYSLDAGFPAQINNWGTETLVIARDSTGQLWATWTQRGAVYVNRSLLSDAVWGEPFALSGGEGLANDDISSIVAYTGRIGIMWSDQSGAAAMRFASRADGEPLDTTFSAPEVAIGGEKVADDHISLKADAGGRLYAATKSGGDPLTYLLVRSTSGTWTTTVFGADADGHTRPTVVLHEGRRRLYYFATAGAGIYMKESSMDSPSFPSGQGTQVIDAPVNNPTSMKHSITDDSGLLVQASGGRNSPYWHYWNPLSK